MALHACVRNSLRGRWLTSAPSQIRNQLRAKCVKVSVKTTRRVMEDAGYRPPKVERRKHDERFEAVRPNHMWHLDFVQRYIHRVSTFTLILIDDHSRYVVGHGVDDVERADMVIETFEEAVRRHGKPEMVMHDKGGAFWSWRGISRFTALLTRSSPRPRSGTGRWRSSTPTCTRNSLTCSASSTSGR
jgi:putative transposase